MAYFVPRKNDQLSRNRPQIAQPNPIGSPEISSVIPGITTVAEANEDAAASDMGPLDAASVDAILNYHAGDALAPDHPIAVNQRTNNT